MKSYGEYIPHDKCPGLVNHARMLTALLGSTYMCEQLFSKMNFAKFKSQTQRNDAHLDGMLVHNVSGTCRVSITLDTKLQHIFHNYINISRCNNIFIV